MHIMNTPHARYSHALVDTAPTPTGIPTPEQLNSPEYTLSELERDISIATATYTGLVTRKLEVADEVAALNTTLSASLVAGNRELSKGIVTNIKELVSEYYVVIKLLDTQEQAITRMQKEHTYLCADAGYAPLYIGTSSGITTATNTASATTNTLTETGDTDNDH